MARLGLEVLLESHTKGSRLCWRIEKQRIMGRERKRMERLRQGSEDLRAGRGHCGTDERGGGIYGGGTCRDSCDGASQRGGVGRRDAQSIAAWILKYAEVIP